MTEKDTPEVEEKELAVKAVEGVDNVKVTDADDSHAEEASVITAPKKRRPKKSNTEANEAGVIGSNSAPGRVTPEEEKPEPPVNLIEPTEEEIAKVEEKEAAHAEPELVALWSPRNIRWGLFGTLVKGYNIVKKEDAERWLTRPGMRYATPQEVAAAYGK